MAEYLVGQGRRRIAMITGPMDTPGGIQRLEGFADVLGRKASKKLIAHGDWTQASGERAMAELLARVAGPRRRVRRLRPDGRRRADHAARRRPCGCREDVAVGGFDDSSVATSTLPPLTTIRQPLAEMANRTMDLLLALIDGAEQVEPVILPTELVIRESA